MFSHRLEVRFRDCDPMGHVNHAVYLTYLEQARFAHWRSLDHDGEPPAV
ncbi:MAG: thioesterase family protein, partial [Vicinamibacterales bacterium]